MTSCEECGFVHEDLAVGAIPDRLRSLGPRYERALAGRAPDLVAARPEPTTWSALEYVCHVRDILLAQRDRAVLAQVESRPRVARMYRDERVSLCDYAGQRVEEVLAHLTMATNLCAMVFEGM